MIFDRQAYMAYILDGTLMARDVDGNVLIIDGKQHLYEASEPFMDEGGEVTLTVRGVPVSKVRLSEDGWCYEEVSLIDEDVRATLSR